MCVLSINGTSECLLDTFLYTSVGAEAQSSDDKGWTAAHFASLSTAGLDFLKELLKTHDALKETCTRKGFTPLCIACR